MAPPATTTLTALDVGRIKLPAKDGRAAVELSRTLGPDVVLMDIAARFPRRCQASE